MFQKNIAHCLLIFFLCLWSTAGFLQGGVVFAQDPFENGEGEKGSVLSENNPEEEEPERPGWFQRMRENLSVNGYLKNETAFRIKDPQGFTKVLNLLRLETQYSFSSENRLTTIFRTYYDAVYDLEDVDTISRRIGPTTILVENTPVEQIPGLDVTNVRDVEIEKTDFELREFYWDSFGYFLPDLDLRIGRQIVRWGVAEQARVTDIINPLDFKEFILREVSDRYIPLWMVKANYFLGDVEFEALWIPDMTFHTPAPRSTEFEQFQFLPGWEEPDTEFSLLGTDFAIQNSEGAFKISFPLIGWDISLSYFYTWDDFVTTFRETFQTQTATGTTTEVVFNQKYTRNHNIGGVFSKGFGPIVLGGEVALVLNKHFGAGFVPFFGSPILGGGGGVRPGTVVVVGGDPQGEEGVIVRDFLKYAIQADFSQFGADFSLQFLQHYIPEHHGAIIQDKFETVLTLFGRRVFANNVWALQLLTLYFINDAEFLIRPRMEYNIDDHLQLAFGSDIFIGEQTGTTDPFVPGDFRFVGFFKNSTRIFIEFKYSF